MSLEHARLAIRVWRTLMGGDSGDAPPARDSQSVREGPGSAGRCQIEFRLNTWWLPVQRRSGAPLQGLRPSIHSNRIENHARWRALGGRGRAAAGAACIPREGRVARGPGRARAAADRPDATRDGNVQVRHESRSRSTRAPRSAARRRGGAVPRRFDSFPSHCAARPRCVASAGLPRRPAPQSAGRGPLLRAARPS